MTGVGDVGTVTVFKEEEESEREEKASLYRGKRQDFGVTRMQLLHAMTVSTRHRRSLKREMINNNNGAMSAGV